MPAAREGRAAGRTRRVVAAAVGACRAPVEVAVVASIGPVLVAMVVLASIGPLLVAGVVGASAGPTPLGVERALPPLPEACRDQGDEPIRVVSLAPAATVTLDSLGLGACIVGRALDDRNPDLSAVPTVGSVLVPDAERVLAARPSLVIAWIHADTRAVARSLGPERVLALPFERLEHAAAAIRAIGRATGREQGAEALAVRLESRLGRVAEAASRRVGAGDTVRVLWAVGYDPPIAAGPGGLPDDLLTLAGGTNVFADVRAPWLRPSREQLVARAADVVVWPRGGDLPPSGRIGRTSAWGHVGALTSGRIHELDADLVHEAGPRVGAAAELLFDLLHGGLDHFAPPAAESSSAGHEPASPYRSPSVPHSTPTSGAPCP